MEDLVFKSSKGTLVTNSLLVAQKFGKQHKDVLEKVRSLTAENSAVLSMFYETIYCNEQNKQQPLFVMNRDGFSLLVMGFTGKEALKFKVDFITAFNKMEEMIKSATNQIPQSFSEALKLAYIQQEQIELQQRQLEEEAPKVAFANAIISAESSCLIGELAKLITQNGISIGQNRLFEWMRNNGYIGKTGERYNIPNQQYIEQGLFELKKGIKSINGVLHTTITPKVTGKGQLYFISKFLYGNVK
ncbi:MAG: hypothetical protein EZS26_000726 [Candidatus Ordinivivax streblomastigis]|uniref:Antirepressor protein C-terminal domain-containing protein n=1 Tax=Candidatus Ordinivivax streblomastigis TaxID=2540710 RepID=A0A5M8P3T6_9BACT|nr:MAG: hypothetical protein EZS26_000726 [Candidatus Ordinivivax streblomastigis]